MAGISISAGGGGRRTVDQEVNMVPFIDLLLVTISFLLVTAVWTSLARIPTATEVPGKHSAAPVKEPRSLHVRVEEGKAVLQWQKGSKVDDVATVPLGELDRELLKAATQAEPGTAAIVHVPNAMPLSKLAGVLDAVHGAKNFTVALGS